MNKGLSVILFWGKDILSQGWDWYFLIVLVFFLFPVPWQENWAYAQQVSSSFQKNDFPLSPSNADAAFKLTQKTPESSTSTSASDRERSGWAITPVIGTLGIGANLSKSIIRDNLNLRGGFSAVVIDDDVNSRGISYDGDLRLSGGIPLVLDWFPFKNWFRVSGGLVINRNRLRLGAEAEDQNITVEIGGQTFESDLFARLDGTIEYTEIAPYIGLGIGNPVGRGNKFRFFLEVGALFQGRGEISLNASGPIIDDPAFQEARRNLREVLEREIEEIDDDTYFDDLPVYPVLQLGFSYQF